MPFVVFEGLDGSGKSTLVRRLSTYLKQKGQEHVVTREPGGTPLAEEIRALLLKKTSDEPVSLAEVLLYEAARSQHVEKLIKPSLQKNMWVLCDRFSASTYAFQCGGRNLDFKMIETIDNFATQNIKPDLTVLLDLSVEKSAERKKNFKLDRLEAEAKDFHERVRKKYLELVTETWLVLDSSSQSPEVLFDNLLLELKRRQWLKS